MADSDVKEVHQFELVDEKIEVPDGELTLIVARSGVGKSAALINFALDTLRRGHKVLHFTADMTSERAHQYYQEIFSDYARNYLPPESITWDEIYHNFMVVSYLDAENMINDLGTEIETINASAQVTPNMIIVDGLEVNEQTSNDLMQLKNVASKHNVKLVASMRIHRATDGHVDLDGPLTMAKEHTDHLYFLDPEKGHINFERVTDEGGVKTLGVTFCPHDLIFKPA